LLTYTETRFLLAHMHLLQDKETLDMQQRVTERELADLREKIALTSRTLGNATGSLAAQEAQMAQLRGKILCIFVTILKRILLYETKVEPSSYYFNRALRFL